MKRSSKILVAVSASALLITGMSGLAGCSNREARNVRNDAPIARHEHREYSHQRNERITRNNVGVQDDNCRPDGVCRERVYRNGRYFTTWGNRDSANVETYDTTVPAMANVYNNDGNYAAYDPDFTVRVRTGEALTNDNSDNSITQNGRSNSYISSTARTPRRTLGSRNYARRDVYSVGSPYYNSGRAISYFRASNGYVRDGAVGDRPGFIGDEGRYMRSSSRYANRDINRSTNQAERGVVTINDTTHNTTRVQRVDESNIATRNGRTLMGSNYTFWGVIVGLVVSAAIITLVAIIVPRRRKATNVNHRDNHKGNGNYRDWD